MCFMLHKSVNIVMGTPPGIGVYIVIPMQSVLNRTAASKSMKQNPNCKCGR